MFPKNFTTLVRQVSGERFIQADESLVDELQNLIVIQRSYVSAEKFRRVAQMRWLHVCAIKSRESVHRKNTGIAQMIKPPTRPKPICWILRESSLYRVSM